MFSSHESRSSFGMCLRTGGRGTLVTRYESSESRLKFRSVGGTHCDGEGARRLRFCRASLDEVALLLPLGDTTGDAVDVVDVVGDGTEYSSFVGISTETRVRFEGDLGDIVGEIELDADVVIAVVGVAEFDCTGEFELGEFTGFKMQRLTCLFKLLCTPNRLPQVSHTCAKKVGSDKNNMRMPRPSHTFFAGVYEQMLCQMTEA